MKQVMKQKADEKAEKLRKEQEEAERARLVEAQKLQHEKQKHLWEVVIPEREY